MKKMVKCPECNREMAMVGLRWHRATKHNIWPNKTNVVNEAGIPPSTNAQTSTNSRATSVEQKLAEKPKETKAVTSNELYYRMPLIRW